MGSVTRAVIVPVPKNAVALVSRSHHSAMLLSNLHTHLRQQSRGEESNVDCRDILLTRMA